MRISHFSPRSGMSKRARDEDELFEPDKYPRRHGADAPSACWDDLVDDTKTLIRQECSFADRVLLGMTCKAERAVSTRPTPNHVKLAQSLLLSLDYALLDYLNHRPMVPHTYHMEIIHVAMQAAPLRTVKYLLNRIYYFPSEGAIPCLDCFGICYMRGFTDILSTLVDNLIAYGGRRSLSATQSRDYGQKLISCGAGDQVLGRYCRYFMFY